MDRTSMSSLPVFVADKASASCLLLFSMVSWATIAAAVCVILLDLLLLCSAYLGLVGATIHMFEIALALGVVLAERESASLLRLCAFQESPLFKGLYKIFVGNLLFVLRSPYSYASSNAWRGFAGTVLVLSGILYTVLGTACFRQLSIHQLGKLRRQRMLKQEMSTLSAQKQELERRLAESESKLELL